MGVEMIERLIDFVTILEFAGALWLLWTFHQIGDGPFWRALMIFFTLVAIGAGVHVAAEMFPAVITRPIRALLHRSVMSVAVIQLAVWLMWIKRRPSA
jgi:hypothetical protein